MGKGKSLPLTRLLPLTHCVPHFYSFLSIKLMSNVDKNNPICSAFQVLCWYPVLSCPLLSSCVCHRAAFSSLSCSFLLCLSITIFRRFMHYLVSCHSSSSAPTLAHDVFSFVSLVFAPFRPFLLSYLLFLLFSGPP